MNKKGWWW